MAAVGFFKVQRSAVALELLSDPLANHLMMVIGRRARFTSGRSIDGLTFGQAFIGDHASYGLTRKQERCARARLEKAGLVKFATSRQGTIATICDSRVLSLRDERPKSGHRSGHPKGHQMGQRFSEGDLKNGANGGADFRANHGADEGPLTKKESIRKNVCEAEQPIPPGTHTHDSARCLSDIRSRWPGIDIDAELKKAAKRNGSVTVDLAWFENSWLPRIGVQIPVGRIGAPAPSVPFEPLGWRDWLETNSPGSLYARGGVDEGKPWAELDASVRTFIADSMKASA